MKGKLNNEFIKWLPRARSSAGSLPILGNRHPTLLPWPLLQGDRRSIRYINIIHHKPYKSIKTPQCSLGDSFVADALGTKGQQGSKHLLAGWLAYTNRCPLACSELR